MNKTLADRLSYLIIALLIVAAAVLYPGLPDPMPSHWNTAGEVDSWMPKFWNVLLLVSMPVFMVLLMKFIQVVSPKGFRTEQFSDVINVLQLVFVAFSAGIATTVFLFAKGVSVDMTVTVMSFVGALFIVLGNYMGKFRKNFFLGIRTPWTLASDEVWAKTHRFGGWLFVLGGVGIIIMGFAGVNQLVLTSILIFVAIVPLVYSFLLYKKIEGFGPDPDEPTE